MQRSVSQHCDCCKDLKLSISLQAKSSTNFVTLLEVGSGFKQLAEAVLREMRVTKQPLQYAFSHHSQMMVGRAKKAFKAIPNMSFQTLDIEQDILAQVEL